MRKTVLLALLAGLIMAPATAANAATRDLRDVSGDVMTATIQDDSTIRYNREGGAEGDIIFARVQHTASQVVIYMRYRQLSVPKQYAGFEYRLEGTNGAVGQIAIETRHAKPQGTVSVQSKRRRCTAAHKINYASDSVSVRIPRRCLRNPKYVRVSHISYQLRETDTSFKAYYDDPTRDGGTLNQVENNTTPWVLTN